MASTTSSDLVGAVIADRYHVISKIGDGGMGQVYLAEHVRMKRKCAVKVMRPGMMNDPDAISRFNREAENASQVIHQNVAAVYDFGETSDGLIYLAMEYVDGESLATLIDREKAVHPVRTAEIIRQAAEALDVAHSLGILHRDLKPENIMIAQTRERLDLVKIVDFGIARAMTSDTQRVTRTGSLVGTPEFMSPEQFAGEALDARTDLYSLALVAFNMLTGATAYPSGTSKDNLIVRLTQPPRRLHEVKDLPWPEELQRTFDKALASDRNERHASVLEFSREMTAAISAMPASQTGEIYISALASALAARATATPSRSGTPVSGAVVTDTGRNAGTDAAQSGEVAEGAVARRSTWRMPAMVLGAAAALALLFLLTRPRELAVNSAATANDSAQLATVPAESLGLAATSAADSASTRDSSTQLAFDRLRSGVISVSGSGGSGLGMLADRQGLLLAPLQLVALDSIAIVMLDDTTRLRARVVASDSARQLAVLAMAPQRCARCAVLPLSADTTPPLAAGTEMFAVGLTRPGRQRLIKGTVSSADERSLKTSTRIGSTESGAPLLSTAGEVIGMSVSQGNQAREIHSADLRIAIEAGKKAISPASYSPPSDALLPVRPRTPFPADPIAAVAAVENLDLLRRYRVATGSFEVLVMTPPVMGWRDARAKSALSKMQGAARGTNAPLTKADPVQGWRGWDACVKERCAVVAINVVPDRTPFLYHKPTEVVDFRSGNVRSVTLMRDGVPVEAIESAIFPAVLNSADYAARNRPVFSQGIALYRAREFAPRPTGGVSRYEVVVVDATRPDRPVRIAIESGIIQAIINDFAQYGLTR